MIETGQLFSFTNVIFQKHTSFPSHFLALLMSPLLSFDQTLSMHTEKKI